MWLDVNQTAKLLNTTERTIRNRIYSNHYQVREIQSSKGRGGKTFLIHITSLPPEARLKHLDLIKKSETSIIAPDIAEPNQNILDYINKYDSEEMDRVLQVEAAIKDIESTEGRKEIGRKNKLWAEHFGVDERTIRSWRKDYSSKGLPALFRKERKDKGNLKSTCQAVADRISYLYLDENRPTLKEVYKMVRKEVEKTDENNCQLCYYIEPCPEDSKTGWKLGSYETATRIINELEYGEKKRYREGFQKCRKDAMPKGRVDNTAFLVNERWVSDHHVCDFYCVDEFGYLARPQLTIWQDFRSRIATGAALSFQGNSKTIAQAFHHGILPKPDSPIKGIPKDVQLDNGKDYRSHYLGQPKRVTGKQEYTREMRGLFSILNIEPHYCKPYTPWAKINESFFKTFKIQFSVHMPGYTGGSADTRPENHEKKLKKLHTEGRIPTLQEAFTMIMDWIDEYHHNHHSELDDTPMNVYTSAPRYEGGTISKEQAAVLLYHTEERKVGRDGIRFDNALYKDRKLYELQGEKVVVRFDPLDLRDIIVQHNGKVVCVAERYTPIRTQEDIAANAKEQQYYMNRLAEKRNGYKQGFTPIRRKKSQEVITGEVLDKPDKDDIVRITGLEDAAKIRKRKSNNKPEKPAESEPAMEPWYVDAYKKMKEISN